MDASVERLRAREAARDLLAKDLQGIAFAVAAVHAGTERPIRLTRRLDDLLEYGPPQAADARLSDRRSEIIFRFAKLLRLDASRLGTSLTRNGKPALHDHETPEFWGRLSAEVKRELSTKASPTDNVAAKANPTSELDAQKANPEEFSKETFPLGVDGLPHDLVGFAVKLSALPGDLQIRQALRDIGCADVIGTEARLRKFRCGDKPRIVIPQGRKKRTD